MAAEADGAQDAASAGLVAFAGAQVLMKDEASGMLFARFGGDCCALGIEGGRWRALDFKAARGVVEIEEDTAAGNAAEGMPSHTELFTAKFP